MHQDKRDGAPTCLSVAPCSVPSSLAWKRRARGEVNATARLDGIACGLQARRSNGTLKLHLQPPEAIEISPSPHLAADCCPCWDGPRRPRDSSCADLLLSAFGT